MLNLQVSIAQDILKSFNLDGFNRFKGKTTYHFKSKLGDLNERSLIVNRVKGDVIIQGTAGDDIIIIETMNIKSLSKKKAEKLFEQSKSKVSRNLNSDLFKIEGILMKSPRVNFNYAIELPSHFNLELHTSGGNIGCDQIVGAIQCQTSGGDIELVNLSGRVDGKTSGGDILIKDSEGSFTVTTSGGEIEIARVDGLLIVKTFGGDIDANHITGQLTVTTSGGDIELSYIEGEKTVAKTFGGDIDVDNIKGYLDVITSGGDIEIYSLNGALYAATSGGDIELNHIDGNINASTQGGSVYGKYISGSINATSSGGDLNIIKTGANNDQDHSISLKALSGDIELVLPINFSSTIDAMVTGTHSSRAIESEFPITITLGENHVKGSAVIGDGNHPVTLKSAYGSIIIERD
ncbi:MAG: DUF4097 family beta strand repeat protein [Candidatus Marinimicrobia bacterium]|jgi:DUF4097 and DUF4098 domain-containing protein YvlB|nr:DUF4097 family beta strand repeat protein [Candidatus Neomarinimicrobiota bacterium]MBT3618001.1 DUF4097 family beta strand repeat protein [Candidatus Neomarinimicrobiota bacterium]MBT3828542.1 DUF4097 family beta strand repeat protein [Candidatus Neomarinimicrobiota bacterium]MBT3997987.1 DUF4097 family beta strand repeat protein [Candidatus Neomarinimicrobiota bacterium]MBT4795697.1 DUF4097 family beta strand repeat protein [Candidatus Neomarinimicrobiota bacterium]